MEYYDRNSSSGGQTDGNGGETKIYMWNKLSSLIKKLKLEKELCDLKGWLFMLQSQNCILADWISISQ